jgi:small subunit ribosomal protein S1
VFVELEADLEGLLHISELSDEKVDSPQDVVKIGEEVEVKILRVDVESRKIGLSLRRVQWAAEDKAAEEKAHAAPPPQPVEEETPRRGGLDGSLMPDSLNIPMPGKEPEKEPEPKSEEEAS